jgi:hypothetical protein
MAGPASTDDISALHYIQGPPGTNNPVGGAQAFTDTMRKAYRALVDKWPNVVVWDSQRRVFGEKAIASTSTNLWSTQIHPSAYGYAITADYLVNDCIALPDTGRRFPPLAPHQDFGRPSATGSRARPRARTPLTRKPSTTPTSFPADLRGRVQHADRDDAARRQREQRHRLAVRLPARRPERRHRQAPRRRLLSDHRVPVDRHAGQWHRDPEPADQRADDPREYGDSWRRPDLSGARPGRQAAREDPRVCRREPLRARRPRRFRHRQQRRDLGGAFDDVGDELGPVGHPADGQPLCRRGGANPVSLATVTFGLSGVHLQITNTADFSALVGRIVVIVGSHAGETTGDHLQTQSVVAGTIAAGRPRTSPSPTRAPGSRSRTTP